MKLRPFLAAFALACCSAPQTPATQVPAAFKPAAQQAPGAAPNKVWLNASTNVYHCPGDRFYGRTKDGKYLTEPAARAAGAHGARNQTCFKAPPAQP
jgi:hypothetical protein